jgi:phosphate uptake regulator
MSGQTSKAEDATFAGDVRDALREMGSDVAEMIASSVRVLSTRDPSVARAVLARESDVNWRDAMIREMCLLHMGGRAEPDELRYLVSALRMASKLERIADLAVRLNSYSLEMDPPSDACVASDILRVAAAAQETVRRAVIDFVNPRGMVEQGRTAEEPRRFRLATAPAAGALARATVAPHQLRQILTLQGLAQCVEMLHDDAVALGELAAGAGPRRTG